MSVEINKSKIRVGNFTSSQIVALTTKDKSGKDFGKPALTYIQEVNMQRLLGRSLTDSITARPLSWGNLMEIRCFDILPTSYILTSQQTHLHREIDYWAGSADGIKDGKSPAVIDIKAPQTLKSFIQLIQPLYHDLAGIDAMMAIRNGYSHTDPKTGITMDYPAHADGDKFYWQLVSGACIENCKYAELIVYMPYESEIPDIKLLAEEQPGDVAHKYYWIAMAGERELPYILDGGYFKNINIIRFEVPQADKDLLRSLVEKAGKYLIERPENVKVEE